MVYIGIACWPTKYQDKINELIYPIKGLSSNWELMCFFTEKASDGWPYHWLSLVPVREPPHHYKNIQPNIMGLEGTQRTP